MNILIDTVERAHCVLKAYCMYLRYKINRMKKIVFCLLSLCFFYQTCYSNDEKETFQQLLNEDSADVSLIAAYPAKVRSAVFEVCTQPQGIATIANVQKESQAKFRSLLSSYSKDEQQKIWNLTRYSGLISKLVNATQLSKQELEDLLKDYPKEVQETGINYALHHFELLKTIAGLDTRFTLLFKDAIKTYSPVSQTAFSELLGTPELISMLNNNMRMAVNLGVIYQKNPDYVKEQFDAINLQQAQQKAIDLEEWKQKMKDDPEAEKELQQSTKEYADEVGYSASDYYETDPAIINNYVMVPYPYWCGYPSWYEYEWWYPYPYWYHWGFTYWHGQVFWHSPPSWFFVHWHFHRHPHFHRYPHITNIYFSYYYGHHRLEVRASETLHRWYEENNQVLPKDFNSNDKNRVEVIRDFGKLEEDYHKENITGTGNLNRYDFLTKNADKYPALKQPLPQQPTPADKKHLNVKDHPVQPVQERPVYKQTPDNPILKPKAPERQQHYPTNRNIQPAPIYQPTQKVQPKPNIQPSPNKQPKQGINPGSNNQRPLQYQPPPPIQPKPQLQTTPTPNNQPPKNQIPLKKLN